MIKFLIRHFIFTLGNYLTAVFLSPNAFLCETNKSHTIADPSGY